ncbi:MAG TPA: hypothetical protein PLA85_11735 [Micropepsaceae bacterium]|nr:hypothetical protein [Micropepsaceae bacterium]HRK72253.1 hypothetical protein [Micropepsaceae bacterium]
MRRIAMAAFGLMALAAPASAQSLDGVWLARQNQSNGVGQYHLTISQGQYALSASLTTPEGYYYENYQSGVLEFYPPDTIRLVVYDWAPREYQGHYMEKPPNAHLQILSLNGSTLTLMNKNCQGPANQCTSTYQRIQ